jgi:branched-chain amino acid transport system permease protein
MGFDFPRFPNRATLVTAVVLVLLPFVLQSVTLASEIVVLAAGALSAALLLGSVGLLSFGQGLYFGVGAYGTGLLLSKVGLGFAPSILLGTLAGALIAIPIGWMIVRRRGVYFVMLTFAFAQMGFYTMHAMGHITGGENGLSGVPRLQLADTNAANALGIYAILAALFFLAFLLVQRLQTSSFGTVLIAIRSNEDRVEALGYNTSRYKLAAFSVAGGIAGLAGAMNTLFIGFVPPSAIELEISERLLIIALIGGTGSPMGALFGAGFYAILADTIGHVWSRWLMIIAALLIVIVLFFKDGLVGIPAQFRDYRARRRNNAKGA